MFSKRIIYNSRSINDTSRVVRMTILSESTTPLAASLTIIILMTLEVSFTIVIFFLNRPQIVIRDK